MKHCIVLGTRPEIIKVSPVLRELQQRKESFIVIHSNQHYSAEMDDIFFTELDLPKAQYHLQVGSATQAIQTAKILERLEPILQQEKPDVIYVQGDTNTVLGAALTASKMHYAIAHIEAGLRSHDRTMPEEINRVITDHLSTYLFAPTEESARILRSEGIEKDNIFIVGNTIVDAVTQNLAVATRKKNTLDQLGLSSNEYYLLTIHRPSNVDRPDSLTQIFRAIAGLYEEYQTPTIFPIHPRTRKQIDTFGLTLPFGVKTIPPVGFLEMLQLERGAKLILTDSGGIQEEACILQRPCVTLRDNTERPETITVGGNILAGNRTDQIIKCTETMLSRTIHWANPYGNGDTAQQIIDATTKP